MSSQDKWPSLTVQQFLQLCNWEGKLLQPNQQQATLNNPLSLTVQQFFKQSNWEGLQAGEHRSVAQQKETFGSVALPTHGQDAWKSTSVKEFFNLCNWQGQPLDINSELHQLDPYCRLKQQVREFFQFIPWEGSPEIGTLPKAAPLPQPEVAPTFLDLSDLF